MLSGLGRFEDFIRFKTSELTLNTRSISYCHIHTSTMMQESVTSPLSNRRGQTLYDKLNELSSEISEGIVNLSDGKRWLVDAELGRLKEEAHRETSPEATYNLLLFRKYSGIANQIKDQVAELQSRSTFPTILPEAGNDSSLLSGMDALKSNLFWLRVVAALFSFISFVVMATVPFVDRAHYLPQSHFQYPCYTTVGGSFNMRPYQFVIGAGVLIYIHTMITSMYYLLPVDNDNQKYIPGFRSFVEVCVNNQEQAEELITSLAACFRTVTRFLECFVDFALVVLSLVAFIIAAVTLDQPSQFTDSYGQVVYYTLPSFWDTYSHTNPVCVDQNDPTVKIRASLAMLFFAFLTMIVCLQVSWRTVKQEISHRTPPSGHRHSNIGAQGIHTEEGREAFLAQPLPTSDSGHDDEDYDEEVAVDFKQARGGNNSTSSGGAGGGSSPAKEVAVQLRSPTTAGSASPKPTAATSGVKASTSGAQDGNSAGNNTESAVRGAGRGAALMRKYEGNQRPVQPAPTGAIKSNNKKSSAAVRAEKEDEPAMEETDL